MVQFSAMTILLVALVQDASAHPGHGLDGVRHSHNLVWPAALLLLLILIIVGFLARIRRRRGSST